MQAQACGLEPTADMNPVLLKPSSDKKAQVIVRGRPLKNMSARQYDRYKPRLKNVIIDSFNRLSKEYEIVVIEGAGSPAEINLKKRDLVNMFVAKEFKSPVILVGDIDKGGVFAWLWGTLGLLDSQEKKRVKALLINKFRGDISILKPGLDYLEKKTNKKILGVIPYFHNIQLDEEDSLFFDDLKPNSLSSGIKVRVLYLPHISNFTDFDALAREPGIELKYINTNKSEPIDKDVDVLIIPGSKSVISDYLYLKKAGYIESIKKLAQEKRANIIGICAGFQMLGKEICDPKARESNKKSLKALGLLDIKTVYARNKITRRVKAKHAESGLCIEGYEIHMGVSSKTDRFVSSVFKVKRLKEDKEITDGAKSKDGLVWGTYVHGIFDNKEFCSWLLNCWRKQKGLLPENKSSSVFDKDKEYDKLAELVGNNIDKEALYNIVAI